MHAVTSCLFGRFMVGSMVYVFLTCMNLIQETVNLGVRALVIMCEINALTARVGLGTQTQETNPNGLGWVRSEKTGENFMSESSIPYAAAVLHRRSTRSAILRR